ncbi:patatin-like protein [Stappia sp. F7233]|uniref:Patatin-like protein n=1 Tax=Stappia albiluteola TaxID=2758565 RepID=A0A839ADT4_9HYPH|nr:patatin-like protein [Stappia albiluteola]MBA5777940.1 patatin-like protein [Stappia albiluteola]
MKQIELRLALVLYGGVSLAVYMHGVTREFLNIVRASRKLEREIFGNASGLREEIDAKAEPVTAALYRSLLEKFTPEVSLRVVVDVVAGASAGGINGVMLARAIAHDLDIDMHRDFWLQNADVTELSNEPVGLTRYLKGSIAPVIDRLVAMGLKSETTDPETREKLRQFVQARWFTPPFSGERFVGWMLDAAAAMGTAVGDNDEAAGRRGTLIPQGQRLDLFVTLTDFHGQRRRFDIDNAGVIEEKEHRRILRFKARHRAAGDVTSEFTDPFIPALVFAARATSSFPGAFPPMTVGEMDHVFLERGEPWFNEADPLERRRILLDKLAGDRDTDPAARVFVDGSVVMNKPFQPVIDAIAKRPASREVVRRLVYVDPLPADINTAEAVDGPDVPGFFRVIFASMAHIPRNEPIGDALQHVAELNREVHHVADVIAAAEPVVEREVAEIIRLDPRTPPTVNELTRARMEANEAAHRAAGYTYFGYQRLKLRVVTESLSILVSRLAALGGAEIGEQEVAARIAAWLEKGLEKTSRTSRTSPEIVMFLRHLDVDYRIRRLRFVILRLNRLYRGGEWQAGNGSVAMDELKTTLYEQVDHLTRRWSREFYGEETCRVAAEFARSSADDGATLANLLELLGQRMGLSDLDRLSDDVFSVMAYNYLPPERRAQLTSAYVGFAFYDLVTLPVLRRPDAVEVNEIRIDRISPSDPHTLRPGGLTLKGTTLSAFGAFFNRRWREHDYLWGRLNAADRLVTLVLSAAGPEKQLDASVCESLRHELFLAILREEAPHLIADPDLVPSLIAEVEARLAEWPVGIAL